MDRELLVEHEWISYRMAVIPDNATSGQLQECRRAFYAGASSLLAVLMSVFDEDREPTKRDMQTISLVDAELRRFAGQVRAGLA